MKRIHVQENGLELEYEILKNGELKFKHFSCLPCNREEYHVSQVGEGFLLTELQVSGLDRPLERHGNKYIVTAPGYRLKYKKHEDYYNEWGRKLEFDLFDDEINLDVTVHQQFYNGLKIIRSWSVVTNQGNEIQTVEYLSSFNYLGIDKEGTENRDKKLKVFIPHNSWQREMNWKQYSLSQLGMVQTQPECQQRSSKRIAITNTGNWSSKEYLPMGCIENLEKETMLFWQIEHNGSWHWEIGDQNGHLYLQLSGPTERESHWFVNLKQGECFQSVPVCVGSCEGGFDEAMKELTLYRRRIRRKNKDNEKLPVIFNDYMNCLWGNPTTASELPMIEAAASIGCEYYVIDAGWYSAGDWWDSVGEWKESKERFPNGLKEVTDKIKELGMVPGVWLELEVMGIHCPKVSEFEEECFFIRHGKKVFDRSRYQLDFRKQKVREYATSVVDRMIQDYGIGYIKMDYNIELGIGTEVDADSVGAGLLAHEQAYLEWLDEIFTKYPDLVMENCSSGGLRIDYALLSRYSIQSTSDTEDYLKYATIAANAPSGVTPEQAAVWSYPLEDAQEEEVVFNMVNSMLLRMHQSGHLVKLSGVRLELVKEAIAYYKTIREFLPQAVPFWPIGYSEFEDSWIVLGMKLVDRIILAVWRRGGTEDRLLIPFHGINKKIEHIECVYPRKRKTRVQWKEESSGLEVIFPRENMARVFELK